MALFCREDCFLVDPRGFEPLAFSMSMKRSNQLSYGSIFHLDRTYYITYTEFIV